MNSFYNSLEKKLASRALGVFLQMGYSRKNQIWEGGGGGLRISFSKKHWTF